MTAPKRALLVIDVQNEYVTGNLRIEYPDVQTSLANIGRVIDAAHAAGIPVVVVQHLNPASAALFAEDSEGGALHPVVTTRTHAHHVRKTMASAFVGTDLALWLRRQGVDTLSIVGYMTHNCDDATARQAAHEGWKVELLHDATGSVPYANVVGVASAEEIHRVFTVVMHTGFAAVVSTDQWIDAATQAQALLPDNIYQSNQRALKLA